VAGFRFSRLAEADLLSIGDYTIRTWGEAQADRYIAELEDCCRRLAGNPGLGRSCDHIRPGLRRMECGRHVVFYRQEAGGILIVRLLHRSMLPERHSIEDQEAGP
jgi:toxin ParE1/3/4